MSSTAEHVESSTFTDAGQLPAVLVVTAKWNSVTESYQTEARQVARWLTSVFCNRTLHYIAQELAPFINKELL